MGDSQYHLGPTCFKMMLLGTSTLWMCSALIMATQGRKPTKYSRKVEAKEDGEHNVILEANKVNVCPHALDSGISANTSGWNPHFREPCEKEEPTRLPNCRNPLALHPRTIGGFGQRSFITYRSMAQQRYSTVQSGVTTKSNFLRIAVSSSAVHSAWVSWLVESMVDELEATIPPLTERDACSAFSAMV